MDGLEDITEGPSAFGNGALHRGGREQGRPTGVDMLLSLSYL